MADDLTDEQLDEMMKKGGKAASTTEGKACVKKHFLSFLLEQNLAYDLKTIQNPELNDYLKRFIGNIKQLNSEEYKEHTLKQYFNMLVVVIQTEIYSHQKQKIDIFKGPEFENARKV